MSVLAYLALLPAAVWLLGAVFALLDRGDRSAALADIAWRGLPFVVAALLLGDGAAVPIVAALATVLGAHLGWLLLGRLLVGRGTPRDADDV